MDFTTPPGATPLDPDEAADLIPTHLTTMGELNEWEGANILAAERWLFSRRRSNVLAESFIRSLHKRMFDETWKWAGEYRRSGKNFGVAWTTIPMQVRQVCENAAWMTDNETLPLVEIAVRLHHGMVSVHPFPNGNGRHTRLLADALLHSRKQPRLTWGRGDLQGEGSEVRARYLAALKKADLGDFAELIACATS